MEYQYKNCPHCSGDKVVKNVNNPNGAQKLKCNICGSHFQSSYEQQAYCLDNAVERVVNLLFERISLRGIARALGLSLGFVCRVAHEFWENMLDFSIKAPTVEQAQDADIQIDELWTYVRHKSNKVWLLLAYDRRSQQVVGWHFGGRTSADVWALWQKIHPLYRKHALFMTDDWRAFQNHLPAERHFIGMQWTHEIEGFFSALRQRSNRLTRKTVGFSKKFIYHKAAIVSLLRRYCPSTVV